MIEKSKGKCGFQGKSRILLNPLFLAEVLHIRIIISSCLAVVQIGRASACFMTQSYKKS